MDHRASYSRADADSIKDYEFLEPDWMKKKKRNSKIFPDFKSGWEKTTKEKA